MRALGAAHLGICLPVPIQVLWAAHTHIGLFYPLVSDMCTWDSQSETVLRLFCMSAQMEALTRPCRTQGRRAAEFLLAAATGRLTWEQVLTGAIVSGQLDSAASVSRTTTSGTSARSSGACASASADQHVVACNACHSNRRAVCGADDAEGCWRQRSGFISPAMRRCQAHRAMCIHSN